MAPADACYSIRPLNHCSLPQYYIVTISPFQSKLSPFFFCQIVSFYNPPPLCYMMMLVLCMSFLLCSEKPDFFSEEKLLCPTSLIMTEVWLKGSELCLQLKMKMLSVYLLFFQVWSCRNHLSFFSDKYKAHNCWRLVLLLHSYIRFLSYVASFDFDRMLRFWVLFPISFYFLNLWAFLSMSPSRIRSNFKCTFMSHQLHNIEFVILCFSSRFWINFTTSRKDLAITFLLTLG